MIPLRHTCQKAEAGSHCFLQAAPAAPQQAGEPPKSYLAKPPRPAATTQYCHPHLPSSDAAGMRWDDVGAERCARFRGSFPTSPPGPMELPGHSRRTQQRQSAIGCLHRTLSSTPHLHASPPRPLVVWVLSLGNEMVLGLAWPTANLHTGYITSLVFCFFHHLFSDERSDAPLQPSTVLSYSGRADGLGQGAKQRGRILQARGGGITAKAVPIRRLGHCGSRPWDISPWDQTPTPVLCPPALDSHMIRTT